MEAKRKWEHHIKVNIIKETVKLVKKGNNVARKCDANKAFSFLICGELKMSPPASYYV